MKSSLIGRYEHNVDEKGRLAVPSKIRVELGEPFYITCLSDKYLTVFSEEEWEKFSDKLNSIPQSDRNAQRYVRMIFADACKCEPDKQGRVLIPQLLRDKVGLDKEVVTIGALSRIEIWPKDKWRKEEEETPVGPDMMSSLSEYNV